MNIYFKETRFGHFCLLENDLIYGCACPLQIIKDNEEYKLIICDYI
jgi:hypothetical protein